MEKTPFYSASGLKFNCSRCSACCRYDSGYVFLSKKDLERLCSFLKIDKSSFVKSYCCWGTNWIVNESLSLKEKPNKDCIFWDSTCSVYEARPLQCRTFPFWDSILSSEYNWEIAASGCKGMNTGKTYTANEIAELLNLRKLEPVISKKEWKTNNE